MSNNDTPVVVVGAGLGGLAASIRLAHAGHRVLILEKNESAGGKCGRLSWEGFHFDTGPSVLTLPQALTELFESVGRNPAEYLTLRETEPACRYHFHDGTVFEAPKGIEAFIEAAEKVFPGEGEGLRKFFRYTSSLWEVSENYFLRHPLDLTLLRRMRWRDVWRGRALTNPRSLHGRVGRFVKDVRLRMLLDRFATYNGSDPYRTPSAFNVITHVETAFGAWHLDGGMYALVEALLQLATELGVEIRYSAKVEQVDASVQQAPVVHVKGERPLPARAVVLNCDAVTALASGLVTNHRKLEKWKQKAVQREASSSGYVLLLALEDTSPDLARHNIFFPENYAHEFRYLFREQRPLPDPTLYISIPVKGSPGMAPPGCEGWFVLVNAPSRTDQDFWPEDYPARLLNLLHAKVPGLSKRRLLWSHAYGPSEFETRLGCWQGSLYGHSSNSTFAAFRRVPNRLLLGIYTCGGSAHPGGGIPLVLWSGEQAARALLEDFPRVTPNFTKHSI